MLSVVFLKVLSSALLFSLFLNYLPYFTKGCTTVLYADDTALLYNDRQVFKMRNPLCDDLKVVSNWLAMHRLTLFIDKTKCLLFESS